MSDYFHDKQLIEKPIIWRSAYSDKMAYLLAELSALVYEELPNEGRADSLVEGIVDKVKKGSSIEDIKSLIREVYKNSTQDDNAIISQLEKGGFDYVDSFCEGGSEALALRVSSIDQDCDDMLVIVFRGTEPTYSDVLTDIKANLVSAEEGGRVHNGFYRAFKDNLAKPLATIIEDNRDLPVYFTGHSLGGALAVVATRCLAPDSTGATYTFGCPRVGDDEFLKEIKTPIYRVVNCADGVARIPFGYLASFGLNFIRYIPVNFTKELSEFLRKHFLGYTHAGSLIFINEPPNIKCDQGLPYKNLVVKKSPDIFWRIHRVVIRLIKTRGYAAKDDHAIATYALKLYAHAKRRVD